jgi:hypothetical protein
MSELEFYPDPISLGRAKRFTFGGLLAEHFSLPSTDVTAEVDAAQSRKNRSFPFWE